MERSINEFDAIANELDLIATDNENFHAWSLDENKSRHFMRIPAFIFQNNFKKTVPVSRLIKIFACKLLDTETFAALSKTSRTSLQQLSGNVQLGFNLQHRVSY